MKSKLFILSFVLFASISVANAAIENGKCGENLTWSLNTKDSTLTIEGSGEMYYTNPQPWDQYASYIKYIHIMNGVEAIVQNAFNKFSNLVAVSIPSSVVSVGSRAFQNCSKLSSAKISDGVSSIGSFAFSGCNSLVSIDIPNSVKNFGNYAFQNCSSLELALLPDSTTYIAPYMFSGCSNLTSIVLPDSVGSIGNYAFQGCYKINSIEIPKRVKYIYSKAFYGCSISKVICHSLTPPEGGADCGIIASNSTLYVPAESLETYANSIWWEDFQAIRPIGDLLMVKFVDWDGQKLSFSYVEFGEAAIAPTNPTREGYAFIGWDKDFSNVTEDLVVTAQYEEIIRSIYTIRYNDKDDQTIASEEIEFHLPEAPIISGFTFLYWKAVEGNIAEGITIQAVYEADQPTSTPEVYTNPANSAQKLIRDGNVYILMTNGTKYSIIGNQIK